MACLWYKTTPANKRNTREREKKVLGREGEREREKSRVVLHTFIHIHTVLFSLTLVESSPLFFSSSSSFGVGYIFPLWLSLPPFSDVVNFVGWLVVVDALIPQRIERNPLAPPLSCETDQWIRRLLAGGICIYIHPPPHPLCISLPLIHTHTHTIRIGQPSAFRQYHQNGKPIGATCKQLLTTFQRKKKSAILLTIYYSLGSCRGNIDICWNCCWLPYQRNGFAICVMFGREPVNKTKTERNKSTFAGSLCVYFRVPRKLFLSMMMNWMYS